MIGLTLEQTSGKEMEGEKKISGVEPSVMRISMTLDLSSLSFIPLFRFIRSRRPTPFLDPSLVLFPLCSA